MKSKNSFGIKWANWILDHRFIVILATILVVVFAGSGMAKLSMSSDYRYFFKEDNPQRTAFDKLQKVYSKDDAAIIAIDTPHGTVFNKETLTLLHKLTKRAWKTPYSYRVDSITNFQNTVAKGDDLIVRDLVRDGDLLDEAQLSYIKKVALTEPLLVGQAVALDGKAVGVTIRVNLPGKSPMETPEVVEFVRKIAEDLKKEYPDHNFYFSGMVMLNNAFNEAGMKDMTTLTPLMYGMLLIITVLFLKSFLGTLATLIILLFSVIAGMGMGGHFGVEITPPSSIAPTIILTLAIADSVHILKSVFALMRRGMPKRDAIIEGLRINFQPVFLTSLTTVIGFVSLNLAETPPLHDLGNITAAGVVFAYLFSITTLPVMISLFPVNVKLQSENSEKTSLLMKIPQFVVRYRIAILATTILWALILVVQIPRIKLNDRFVNYFDKRIEFRTHTDWMTSHMSGIYQVEFDLKSAGSQGISDPKYLQTVDDFANMYRQVPEVTHVNTLTDTIKRLNKNMHGDDPNYYKLPNKRELAAQYLLLYEMSLPYGLDLNNQIDVDKSSTRVIVTFGDTDTTRMIEIANIGEEWLKMNAPEHMHTFGVSPTVMFSHITNNNVKAMFWGTLFAFFLITLTLIISLRSLKYGLISLLPNIFPAGAALGIWTLWVGEAGFALSVVFSVTLGIVVDDTVHFLSKYVRAKREKGLNAIEAINDSFANVGSALVATTVILIAGFSVMMMSTFKMNFILGILSVMTIAIALAVDFTFLPALLITIDGNKKELKNEI
jgi:uncharacterized protein